MMISSASHPIVFIAQPCRVVLTPEGASVADAIRALRLEEAKYAPVDHLPLCDVQQDVLTPSAHTTDCPYKGVCSYLDLAVNGPTSKNALWMCEQPYECVAAISDLAPSYPNRVDGIRPLP